MTKDELKFMIDETINNNGNRGITGKSLNLALSQIVEAIGENSNNKNSIIERSDVNFFDYDGTLLYAYTWEDALKLSELPKGPEHDGLIFQEWNYTLEDIKEQGTEDYIYDGEFECPYLYKEDLDDYHIYVSNCSNSPGDWAIAKEIEGDKFYWAEITTSGYNIEFEYPDYSVKYVKGRGYADVGANYVTADGKTRYYISNTIPGMTYGVYCPSKAIVSWGDGTIDNIETPQDEYGNCLPIIHTYTEPGDVIIEVEQETPGELVVMNSSVYYGGYNFNTDTFNKIEFGNKVTGLDTGNSTQLLAEVMSIPTNLTQWNIHHNRSEIHGKRTKCVILPKTIDSAIATMALPEYSNCILSIPNVNLVSTNSGFNITTDRLVIPKGITLAGSYYSGMRVNADELIINSDVVENTAIEGIVKTFIFNGIAISNGNARDSYDGGFRVSNFICGPKCQYIGEFFDALDVVDLTQCVSAPYIPEGMSLIYDDSKYTVIYPYLQSNAYKSGNYFLNARFVCKDDLWCLMDEEFSYTNYIYFKPGFTWGEFIDSEYNGLIKNQVGNHEPEYEFTLNPDNHDEIWVRYTYYNYKNATTSSRYSEVYKLPYNLNDYMRNATSLPTNESNLVSEDPVVDVTKS